MSKPKEIYKRAINGEITFFDHHPRDGKNVIPFIEKQAADKLAEALEQAMIELMVSEHHSAVHRAEQALAEYRGSDADY